MKITKKEIEKILGYKVTNYKITKRAYQGTRISSVTVVVQPENYSENVTVTIKPTK